jgi:DNA repair exonuclease SbcCD ATPase subunit
MRVSEQVGELRTMILEREKAFGFLESDFEMIKNVFEDIKPAEFSKELDKKEKEIVENKVKIEKLESMVEKLGKEVSGFRTLLDKIKSFDNLLALTKEIDAKVSGVEDAKKYTDRLAAKTETIFSELSKKLRELEDMKGKIEKMDELLKELVRSIDDLGVKLSGAVDKKELKEEIQLLDDSLTKKFSTPKVLEERLEILSEVLDSLERRVRMIELDKVSTELGTKIKELSPGSEEMSRIEKLTREWKDMVDLMESVESDYKSGAISKESFEEFKKKNEEKLAEIKKIINQDVLKLKESIESTLGPLPEVREAPEIKPETNPGNNEIERKLQIMETEKGVIQNLIAGLSSEEDEAKRRAKEKKYKMRLEKLNSELKKLREGA